MTTKQLFLESMRRTDAREHDGYLALQAADCEWVVPVAELCGREQVQEWLRAFWQAFSSYRHEIRRVVDDGDCVYAEGVFSGVQDGPLTTPDGVLPATGKSVALRFAMVVSDHDLASGTARSVHLYFDQLEFLGQLGLLPEPATAA
jgi:predicted ester cyclase